MKIFLDLHCHCVEMLYWWVWIRQICTWYAAYDGCMLMYLNAWPNCANENKTEIWAAGFGGKVDWVISTKWYCPYSLASCSLPLSITHNSSFPHLRGVSFLWKSLRFFIYLISPLMQNPPLLALVWSASFTRAQAQGLGCCHERCSNSVAAPG